MKSNLKIFLAMEPCLDSSSHIFSTLDSLDGFITFQPKHDVRIHSVEIYFKGAVETTLQRDIPTRGATPFSHTRVPILALDHAATLPNLTGVNVIRAGEMYKAPIHFVIPDHVYCAGFGLPQPHADSRKQWQSVLPPSFDPSAGSNPLATLLKQYGKISYSISAVVYGVRGSGNDNGSIVALGQGVRQIRLKPRPMQINLLKSQPFTPPQTANTVCPLKTKLLRRRFGAVCLEPVIPEQGLTCVGRVTRNQSNEFKQQLQVILHPKGPEAIPDTLLLTRVKGELRVNTSYSAIPMVEQAVELGLKQEHEKKSFVVRVTEANLRELPAESTSEANSHQRLISISWELTCCDDIAPSFITLLISRLHELRLRLYFAERSTGVEFLSIPLTIPINLSLQPSEHPAYENWITALPAYKDLDSLGSEAFQNPLTYGLVG